MKKIAKLRQISMAAEHSHKFHHWCLSSLRLEAGFAEEDSVNAEWQAKDTLKKL